MAPEFNKLLCGEQKRKKRKLDCLHAKSFVGSCSQILHFAQQTRTPPISISPLKKTGLRREWVLEVCSTTGVGWDAEKVNYEVFPSYLLSTRLSLVIKSVLLLLFLRSRLVWVEYYELIVSDNGDERPQCSMKLKTARTARQLRVLRLCRAGDSRLDLIYLWSYVDLKQVMLS